MKDNLGKYLEDHREALDADTPNGEMIWEGVQADLVRNEYRKRLRIWQLAATIAILLSAGYVGWDQKTDAAGVTIEQPANQASVLGAFASMENSYQAEVQELTKEVEQRMVNPEAYGDYFEALKSIEETEEEFKQDIMMVDDKQRLAMILVDTYEKKIRLLEKILLEMERQEPKTRARKTSDNTQKS